jgi:hypothetical protein
MAENKFELRENQIMIFKNEKREKDSHPEYKGKMKVNGEIREISLWVKTSNSGKKFFSGEHQPEWKPTQQSTPAPPPAPEPEPDNDLPF